MSNKKIFKEGEVVAHIENLQQKMNVARILKEVTTYPTGETDNEGNPVRKKGSKMIGIECHWWEAIEERNTLRKERFHSRELIPWNIAERGIEAVKDFQEKR